MFHGLTWHAGSFRRLLPFAHEHNTRIVLVNRRDYPSAAPFNEEERKPITAIAPVTPEGAKAARLHLKNLAHEIYSFLVTLIETENIPKEGGIILSSWSFGNTFMSAFLAHAASFPIGKVNLVSYIRYIANLDYPSHFLGYTPKPEFWNPMLDPTIAPDEGIRIFPRWVSGYFMHGETVTEIEPRNFAPDPPPTLDTMSEGDLALSLCVQLGTSTGSDTILMYSVLAHGICMELRKTVMFSDKASLSQWDKIKMRHIW